MREKDPRYPERYYREPFADTLGMGKYVDDPDDKEEEFEYVWIPLSDLKTLMGMEDLGEEDES